MNKFPCVVMRGGTSKGVFFKTENMPKDRALWERFLLDVMGSPDPRQIDGLGGANSLTSKVAIIGPSDVEGVDVDYTFAQVSINQQTVDFKGNCGNISSAVAPFAIDEGMIAFDRNADRAQVVIRNTNTDKIIEADIKVKDGKFDPAGEIEISGVPGSGSRIGLSFLGSEGAVTGKLMPTDHPVDRIQTSKGEIEISIVDAANPLVFIKASDVKLSGNEAVQQFTESHLAYIEEIRSIAAELCGFAGREDATLLSPAVPKATIVSPAQDYITIEGVTVPNNKYDVSIRMMSMQKPHQALAITGAVCISVAAGLEGTLVNALCASGKEVLRIGHPGGVMETSIKREGGKIQSVEVLRTARRIMEGYVFTHINY